MKSAWITARQWGIELGKWALVIFLLLPLQHAGKEAISFGRVALGIMLFIIFSGKMFYDAIIDNFKRQQERSTAADLAGIVIMVLIMTVMTALVIASIGLMVWLYMQQATAPQS